MQDAIAGFQEAPLWVQVAITLFAAMAVYSLVGPSIRQRKFRGKFNAIARALGVEPPAQRGWPVAVRVEGGGRPFELRHDLRSSSKGMSYRGPLGHLLIAVTRLDGTKWPMHQVDLARSGRLARLVNRNPSTGDPEFDERFTMVQDGVPVRDRWLDGSTRRAIARFFDLAPASGIIWIRDGELQLLMQDPWPNADGPAFRALLERQAVLATALETTAASRW